ncbi:ImmA/IrrE family metallo-endopeptidase [Streptococcus cristatus]|uniref:ImmA/IrrE family metallo-endopeptidase n=1 Tax=Streptococcus cristatus TaxID=45634 RepID=UPI0011E83C50|nr:ImmA/IrrE family metallo-endopeptidase [Streptococcus cristatus]
MNKLREKEIRRKANEFRELCTTTRYGIANLFRDCKNFNIKLFRYPMGEDADLGFTLKRDNDTIIFTNTSIRLSREIFTLAHEIGHAVLHFENMEAFFDNNSTVSDSDVDEKEHEANYFAACLLMPQEKVEGYIYFEIEDSENISARDIAKMMVEFNVSFDMVVNRLCSLQFIDEHKKTLLNVAKVEAKVGNLIKSVGGGSALNRPSEEIVIPEEYSQYALYNFNNGAMPKETLEKVLGYYHLSLEDFEDEIEQNNAFSQEDDADDINLDDLIGGLSD